VVVFTGAGMSAESGIATFRDREGLWARFPPEHFGNWPGLLTTALRRPRRLAEFLIAVLEPIATAGPNAGHRAVAELEDRTQVTVVTQNVDGLHQVAGSTVVHEIHGSLFDVVTLRGRFVRRLSRPRMRRIVESLRRARRSRLALPRLLGTIRPLLGLGRRGVHRPGVVLFGEGMAEPAWTRALEAVRACHCLISVGTSGAVMPAAGLPLEAGSVGATVIHVDPAGGYGDLRLRGTAADVLPALVQAAFGGDLPER
jgi:NAD-dependent deacetylase